MANSFRDSIERLIGTDYERCSSSKAHAHHGQPAPRFVTRVPVTTVGGLEDHPLFARALLERAREIAQQPGRESIILAAHGKHGDDQNAAWMRILASLRDQMLESGGREFRAIETGTWREDWPDKREPAVAHIRDLVERGNRDGGRVLLIPARTTGRGPAAELIPDLDFALGEGFSPHPLFVSWLQEQVRIGIEQIKNDAAPRDCAGSLQR